MATVLNLSPDMWMVGPDGFERLWGAVESEVAEARSARLITHLETLLGSKAGALPSTVTGLHHVGVYIGDYTDESLPDEWQSYLLAKLEDGELQRVERGPSYIAPRQYGAPGWWWSVTRSDGFVIEMFSCRNYGRWAGFPPDKRRRLMSHAAFSVSKNTDVLPLMKELVVLCAGEIIAFTDEDELGHTYGHVRNASNDTVIEIVFEDGLNDRLTKAQPTV